MPVYNESDKKKWTKDKRHWYFRCTYEDINGNKKRYKSKMYLSKSDAEDAESEFVRKSKLGNYDENTMTFDDLYFEWLETKKKVLKTSTFYQLKVNSDKNIYLNLKGLRLNSFKTSTINKWIDSLDKNLSLNYKNKMIKRLKNILIYARDNYNFNPKIVSYIQPIKNEAPINKTSVLTNYWTLEQFNCFIKYVDNDLDKLIFDFLYYTGCRVGEAIALNWNDIDFKNKKITINKTLTNKLGTGNHLITSPKTLNSVREVYLPDKLLNELKTHYNNEKKIYRFNKNMFIFGNVKYISVTTITRHLNKYIELSSSKKITLHGFRHSHVSLLIYLGCNFRDVAERVGDTIEMVQNTYYHMFPEEKNKAVELLNSL